MTSTSSQNDVQNKIQTIFELYQLKSDPDLHYHRFISFAQLTKEGKTVEADNYNLVYTGSLIGPINTDLMLDYLYETFNIYRPKDFTGHSLSVSDVITLKDSNSSRSFYVDSFGFEEIPLLEAGPALPSLSDQIGKSSQYENQISNNNQKPEERTRNDEPDRC